MTNPCNSCEFRNIMVEASMFCYQCEETLCDNCYHHHKVSKMVRSHTVVPLQFYYKHPFKQSPICDEHGITYDHYCTIHNFPVCSLCVPISHRLCHIVPIHNALVQLKNTIEQLSDNTFSLFEKIKDARCELNSQMNRFSKSKDTSINQIESRIKEASEMLRDKLVSELQQSEQKGEIYDKKLREQEKAVEIILNELYELRENVNLSAENINLDYLVEKIKIEDKFREIESDFNEIRENKFYKSINSRLESDTTTLRNVVDMLATNVNKSKSAQTPHHMDSLQLHKLADFHLLKRKNATQIRGCVILKDDISCFADRGNNRLVFITTKGFHREIELQCAPLDITAISESQIAVSLYESQSIQILDIDTWTWEPFKFKSETVLGGLTFHNNEIIVRLNGIGYCGINLDGNVMQTISISDTNVPYVACARDLIFSANWDKNEVYCFNMSGKKIWTFNNESVLGGPNCLATDTSGNIYVTGSFSNNVVVVSETGSRWKEILCAEKPIAIDYNKSSNLLLVSYASGTSTLFSVKTN